MIFVGLFMDYVQLLFDILPNIPPENLRDWAFIIIIIPAISRIILLSTLYSKFSEIFPTKRVKATRLLIKLRIPGLKRFAIHQSSMILLPALISLPILYYSGLDEIYWRDLPSQTATLATIGLVLWTIFGIYKAIELREEVREILVRLEDLLAHFKSIFKGIAPSNMSQLTWVLKQAVVIRKKMDSAKSWAGRKIPSTIEENILPFLGSLGEAITEFISRESKKVTEKIQELTSSTADWATEKVEQELDRLFHSYIEKSNMVETARVIAFSAFPSIWLALIAWQSGVGF